MGKIFGISDNPVSTIESALRGQHSVEPPFPREIARNKEIPADKFVKKGKKLISTTNISPTIKFQFLFLEQYNHKKISKKFKKGIDIFEKKCIMSLLR